MVTLCNHNAVRNKRVVSNLHEITERKGKHNGPNEVNASRYQIHIEKNFS